ncbi:tRNA lysidine(34) synthetase TilS [Undibacterium sp. 14-3-2]|uniref:tRNA lysidine(34) synthetase TilS n=1 Tax=Undibacterium sp. 14-3-2 TaxID=2800129 RepID=UPI00190571E6|nr:tRNA lysidine(34) synthetase TilS [Undibacterium sp. 14-3-2]MBK1891015.1 tRNA lysidine(34) synthetase TilS [Undibacterium sp. 14-3-2]
MNQRGNSGVLTHRFSEVLDSYFSELGVESVPGMAIAFSGGLDSSALLMLAIEYCRLRKIPLVAIHIHHGLSTNADSWLEHCRSVCLAHNVTFLYKKVTLDVTKKEGVESSARSARYQALGRICQEHQINFCLTAHHQDDQAETLLMQMLRGSGVAGLSGMDRFNTAESLLGVGTLMLMRPLLQETRGDLEQFVDSRDILHIHDESNDDARFLRNALRHKVMPMLEEVSPGFSKRIARTATHMRSTRILLEDLAGHDLSTCSDNDGLSLQSIRSLSPERVNNLLRLWFARLRSRMPTTSRLTEILKQLFDARDDARVTVFHDNLAIHRYRDRIYATSRLDEQDRSEKSEVFKWSGEDKLEFPGMGGTLYFQYSDFGVDCEWLKGRSLELHFRRGGERLKLAENRSTRDMKSHYQSLKIPFWVRQQLPFVSIGDQLIFAAGVGMQSSFCSQGSGSRILLKWVAEQSNKVSM